MDIPYPPKTDNQPYSWSLLPLLSLSLILCESESSLWGEAFGVLSVGTYGNSNLLPIDLLKFNCLNYRKLYRLVTMVTFSVYD